MFIKLQSLLLTIIYFQTIFYLSIKNKIFIKKNNNKKIKIKIAKIKKINNYLKDEIEIIKQKKLTQCII